jgi:hypothetical protein
MRILLIAALACCLLLQLGCKKVVKSDPTGEKAIRERVAEQQKGSEEGGVAQAGDAIASTGEFKVLTQGDADKIRMNLVSWAPDYGVIYDKAGDQLMAKDNPQSALAINDILVKIDQRLKMQEGQPEQISQEELTRRILQNMHQIAQPEEASQQQQQQLQQEQAQAQAEAGNAVILREAQRVWGEWKSIREESPHHQIAHNDQYFEFMNLWYEGNRAEFRLIRDGKLFSVDEYKFAYDAAKGDLIILDPKTGKELKTMKAYENANDKTLLYVSSDGGRTKKVFTKVGRAGAPLTPEEKALQDKAAGFGQGDGQS